MFSCMFFTIQKSQKYDNLSTAPMLLFHHHHHHAILILLLNKQSCEHLSISSSCVVHNIFFMFIVTHTLHSYIHYLMSCVCVLSLCFGFFYQMPEKVTTKNNVHCSSKRSRSPIYSCLWVYFFYL